MKLAVWCDSGANCHSRRKDIIDLESDWDISDEEWINMSEEQKQNMISDWAISGGWDLGWEEIQ